MKTKSKIVAICVLVFSMLLSSCGTGQLFGPCVTPTLTPTSTPTFTPDPTTTLTPTATFTPTATLTPTPALVCNPNTTVQGAIDNALPEYIDILSVSTTLDGTYLTVVFTMRGIPEEITIDKNTLETGKGEIGWGVAIDTDGNLDTGISTLMTGSGYGYDYLLQAFNFKQGSQRSGAIQDLFRNKTSLWISNDELKGWMQDSAMMGASGRITVDQEAKTITLNGNIKGITPNSHLHFFTAIMEADLVVDEICQR